MISEKDRCILRDLAKKQLEYAKSDEVVALKKEWRRHNSFGYGRPMIKIETETFTNDIIPQLLQCEGEYARALETVLRTTLINHEVFEDDSVIRDHIPAFGTPEEAREAVRHNPDIAGEKGGLLPPLLI